MLRPVGESRLRHRASPGDVDGPAASGRAPMTMLRRHPHSQTSDLHERRVGMDGTWVLLSGPLAWGANLWLLMVGWPAFSTGGDLGLALAAGLPWLAGLVLLGMSRRTAAGVALLALFPAALGAAVITAAIERGPSAPSLDALVVLTASLLMFGYSATQALRAVPSEQRPDSAVARIEPLRGAPPTRSHNARTPLSHRVATTTLLAGAASLVLVAPHAGSQRTLTQSFGEDPRHGAVLVAMVGAALAASLTGPLLTALLKPYSPNEARPRAPLRVLLSLALAVLGAITLRVLRAS